METTNQKKQLARIDIPVTGMTCASCVRRVERALSKKEGVTEAGVEACRGGVGQEAVRGICSDRACWNRL
jgi:copper chaperone CopZ